MNETAGLALATFFATIGPLDVAAMFAALTANLTVQQKRSVAIRGTLIGAVILVAFALIGEFLPTVHQVCVLTIIKIITQPSYLIPMGTILKPSSTAGTIMREFALVKQIHCDCEKCSKRFGSDLVYVRFS